MQTTKEGSTLRNVEGNPPTEESRPHGTTSLLSRCKKMLASAVRNPRFKKKKNSGSNAVHNATTITHIS
jgi:hypothetical protein